MQTQQQPQKTKYAIVGFGIAGQLLTLELLQRGINPTDILIIDKNFLGGTLVTDYPTVVSNTPWAKTRQALAQYTPHSDQAIAKGDKMYEQTQCMPVRDIATLTMQAATRAAVVERLTTNVKDIQYISEQKVWKIQHTFGTILAQTLFLCHGAQEKLLDTNTPCLPLTIALNKDILATHVTSEDRIVLFGTAHSGTIILKHLHELNVPTTAIYNTPQPFLFARDGEYDGVKEGSEKIADAILRGEYANLNLVSWSDTLNVHKVLNRATKTIHCVGFQVTPLGQTNLTYDPQTAKVGGPTEPNLYGYGIAFPGVTEANGRKYPDVSVLSFQEQIRRTLPQILSASAAS